MPRSSSAMPRCLRMARDVRERRGVPEQHPWPQRADPATKLSSSRRRHLEGREEMGASQHAVAKPAQPVLCAEFDRRAPDHDLRSPMSTSHQRVARHLAATSWLRPALPMKKISGSPGRAAGVVARERAVAVCLHGLGVGADLRSCRAAGARAATAPTAPSADRIRCARRARGSTARVRRSGSGTRAARRPCSLAISAALRHWLCSRRLRSVTDVWPLSRSCSGKIAPEQTRV